MREPLSVTRRLPSFLLPKRRLPSALLLLSSLVLLLVFSTVISFQTAALLLLILASPLLMQGVAGAYVASRRQSAIERDLPYALFHVAAFPSSSSFEQRVTSIADAGFGPLSKEFLVARRAIQNGYSFPESLLLLRKRNRSRLFHRALSLLACAYRSGADPRQALKQLAEDASNLQQLARENTALLSLQRYTLLLSCSLLVPAILGFVLHTALSLHGTVFTATEPPPLTGGTWPLSLALHPALQLYLFLFSALACSFAALQEGNLKKAAVYALVSGPVSLLVFEYASHAAL